GLTIVEATGVTPEGRISPYDMGLWSDDHIEPLARIVRYYHSIGAKIGIQIGHAGRKASTFAGHSSPSGRFQAASDADGGWEPVGPSAVPFNLVDHRKPREITLAEIAGIKKAFVDAAKRADEAGFDVLEIHGAHGYLISSFLSPNANKRTDHYGGSFENRTRLLLEIVEEVRANGVWPESKPLFVRVSANEWVEGGWTSEDTQRLAPLLYAAGVDLIDVSSGGINAAQQIPVKPQYQTPFSADLKRNVPGAVTGTVGMINEPEEAEEILQRDDADLILLGRNALREPQWPLRAA
ncbi:NADH:flavin oxidoreductase/NADH oxidase, partial [Ramicandelaber brevisporus]